MKASIKNIEQTIASEQYRPALSGEYQELFQRLTRRLEDTLPMNRARIISDELRRVSETAREADLDCQKYMAALSVLVDLSLQGWIFDFQDHQLTLRMENDNIDDKEKIRYRLSAERNAQFKSDSVARFIKYMEAERNYNGTPVSVKCLIGNRDALILAIRTGRQVCAPYIQMVTGSRDEFTGFKLSDIWRYFRYTWSIPYKTMPGRNIYYLVRDSLQPYHPIIGIFALGNSVLNLTVRDDDIGWTIEAIKAEMSKRVHTEYCEQTVSGTDGKRVKVKIQAPIETEEEYLQRRYAYAERLFPLLVKNVNSAISEIYTGDLGYYKQTKYPRQEQVDELYAIAAEYSERSINNRNNETSPDWREEAKSNLFKRKRASELAKLLEAKIAFNNAVGQSNEDKLLSLLASESGRKAIHTALIANRKCKIGSSMMDIIVCGSIPPYNHLLGGKLVSILACSPRVISDYTHRYEGQISEIASRMKGEQVIRDSRLVYLGTTSLYAVGSSQYNRIKVPLGNGRLLEFRKMGVTEGYGTVFFSRETTALFSRILELQDGGKRINHVFGEGTSPRFRMISRGLSSIGIRADAFLKHYSSRIVYSIDLAKNTKEYLMGYTNAVDYGFNPDCEKDIAHGTQALIDYWYNRWLMKRLTTVDIVQRLNDFAIPYKKNYILLNTSMANRAVADSIKRRRFSFLGRRETIYTEHYVGGYKSDIYIQDTNTIIEVKSVLSTEKCALFPTVFSERALKQLEKLRDLLSLGYRVHYSIISLNPYVNSIYFVSDAQFTPLLKSCIDLGMTISAFSCRIDDNRVCIDKRLQILLP